MIVLVSTVVLLALTITLTIVLSSRGDEQTDAPPASKHEFVLPLESYVVAQQASLDRLVYNPTLKEWRTVNGVIMSVEQDQDVKAVTDGTVVSVSDTLLQGTVITIDHGDGLTSKYLSLAESPAVKEGDVVKAGDILGQTSNRLKQYEHFKNQLYLEMQQVGKFVDPMTFLPSNEQ
jgi:murein DD-endopeptidase MepM/ murein hydrolase activator NlpD